MHLHNDIPFSPRRWPFFYGYMILFAATVGTIMSVPGQTIGVSVFTDSLIEHVGISRFWISLAYGLGTVGSSLIIGPTGRLLDTIGARIVGIVSAIGLGLVLIYLSQVDRIARLLPLSAGTTGAVLAGFLTAAVGFLLLRYLGQGVLTLASRTMLMRWFDKRRGTATAVMGVFIAFTFSAAPMLFELLIRRFGWRGAWLLLGVAEAIGFSAFVLFFFRDDPHSCGLHPDGVTPDPGGDGDNHAEESWTLPRARGTLTFWVFNLGLSLFSLQVTALTFHIVSIFKTGGLTRADAVSVFLPASMISVALNFGGGLASDRAFVRHRLKWYLIVLLGGVALSSAGALTPVLRSGLGRWMIIAGHGTAGGFFGLLTAIVWPRYFGPKHLGAISGYNVSFMVFASAVGPPLFGAVQNQLGGYDLALGGGIAVVAILAPLALWANKPSGAPIG